jgi:hypothetical protein
MRNVQAKVIEKNKTHFVFNKFSQIRALYEITWKNYAGPERPQITI